MTLLFCRTFLRGGASYGHALLSRSRLELVRVTTFPAFASTSAAAWDATRSWRRDAWPIPQPGDGGTLLHCLAGSPDGETTTAAFRGIR